VPVPRASPSYPGRAFVHVPATNAHVGTDGRQSSARPASAGVRSALAWLHR